MNADQEAQDFLKNASKMEALSSICKDLREIGFERVLRRLGEPVNLDSRHPQFTQIAAAQQAENAGWFKAIDTLFNFAEVVSGVSADAIRDPDYGGREMARQVMGYTEGEIEKE